MSAKQRKQVAAELEQLHHLIEPLLDRGAGEAPTAVETVSPGRHLHSFYNGIENIFKRVALDLDGELMARRGALRPAVISEALRDQLTAYSFLLEWEKLASLAQGCEQTFALLKIEVEEFLRQVAA